MHLGAHRLKGNKTSRYPQQVIFFDTETSIETHDIAGDKHVLKLGWAVYQSYRLKSAKGRREQWLAFTDTKTFCEWFESKIKNRRRLYVIAANVWFDMRVTGIDLYLMGKGYHNTRLFQKGLTTIIGFTKDRKTVIFMSIQNLIPWTVKKIGAALDLPKLGVDFDKCTDEELSVYSRRDCEIIKKGFEWWISFCKEHDLGCFGITYSSQAFNAFRHRFMSHAIYIHDREKVIALERDGYFGGRVECFWIGRPPGEKFYKLDVNSLYSAVMERYEYPTKLVSYRHRMSLGQLRRKLRKYYAVARVLIDAKAAMCPVRHLGKTCFPLGVYETVVCTEALKRLLSDGCVISVNEIAFYKHAPIFKKYVEALNELKEDYTRKEDKFRRKIVKKLQNCLYGKFGQRRNELFSEEEAVIDKAESYPAYDNETGKRYWVVIYGGRMKIYEQTNKNSFNTFVAIAAHVTENARLFLFDHILTAGRDNVFYCDTDSIFTNDEGYRNLEAMVDSSRLGAWKLEGVSSDVVLRSPKDYTFGDDVVRKGIRRNAVQIAENVYEQDYFPSFRTSIKEHLEEGFRVKRITKTLSDEYDKGQVLEDGMVVPFYFNRNDRVVTSSLL